MKVKISKKHLQKLILEETKKLLSESHSPMKSRASQDIAAIAHSGGAILNEMWGGSVETGSDLIDFAKAYSSLGSAVQQQVEMLANAYIVQGAHDGEWDEAVYEQNPNAIDMAEQRLTSVLKRLSREGSEDAGYLLDMFEEAQKIYRQGDAEVEADRLAAEGDY